MKFIRPKICSVQQIRMKDELLNYNRTNRYLYLKRNDIQDSMETLKEMDEEVYRIVREII